MTDNDLAQMDANSISRWRCGWMKGSPDVPRPPLHSKVGFRALDAGRMEKPWGQNRKNAGS